MPLFLSHILFRIFCIVLISKVSSYIITVQPFEEECFFERVNVNDTMTKALLFEVTDGGFLDIDFHVKSPAGKRNMYVRRSSYAFRMSTNMSGIYEYCFSNQFSSLTTKVVTFDVVPVGPSTKADSGNKSIDALIYEVTYGLSKVLYEQIFLAERMRGHRHINDSTNNRLVVWAIIEFLIVAVMSVSQIIYLKSYFEVRRIV